MMKYLLWVFVLLMIFTTPLSALVNYENGAVAFDRGDYETDLREFKVPAKQISVLGSYETGTVAFDRGDYETALREFKALAEQNDSRGQYGLALMYDLGAGVPADLEEAAKWYHSTPLITGRSPRPPGGVTARDLGR